MAKRERVQKRLLSVRQAARMLCVQPRTLYQHAAAGQIPYVILWNGPLKRTVRFRLDQVLKHIERNTRRAKKKATN